MSSGVSIGSGGFSPVTTGPAAEALEGVKTGLTIAAEASAPLTFNKLRRVTEGSVQLLLVSLLGGIVDPTR